MAVERVGAGALGIFLTGASADLGARNELGEVGAVGGCCSCAMPLILTPVRVSAMPGVWVLHASGANGLGVGTLEAVTTGSLRWKAPGESPGAAVAIAEGETRILYSSTAGKYVVVRREVGALVTGSEAVQLCDTYNNVIGGSNFESAEAAAGAAKYLAVAFRNVATDGSTITGLKVWVDPDDGDGLLEIASETPVGDAVQDTDENTEPTGLSWVSPTTEGAALSLGTLAVGEWKAVWRKRYVETGALWSAHTLGILRYSFTVGAVNYTGQLRGLNRVSNGTPDADGIVQYELYVADGRVPNPEVDSPVATDTAKPVSASVSWGVGIHKAVLMGRNRWGILQALDTSKVKTFNIDSEGESVGVPPMPPVAVSVSAAIDGKALISASYVPAQEAQSSAGIRATRANKWVVYASTDGSDPLLGTPVVVAMRTADPSTASEGALRGREIYRALTATGGLDGAPLRVVVRTRRDDGVNPAVDSTNTTEATSTAQRLGPQRPLAYMTFAGARGEAQPVTEFTGDTYWIDEAKNIRIDYARGSASFYGDTELVWRCIFDSANPGQSRVYLNSDWSLKDETISGAGVAAPFEVASWSGTHVLYACVNGVRRLKIDFDNQVISGAWKKTAALTDIEASSPAIARYADTVFVVYDPTGERMVSYLAVASDGVLTNAVPWNQWKTQAEIEAL